LTDEITTILTWSEPMINYVYKNSTEDLSMDALIGNLTDFNPINTTSYTHTDSIEITFQPSNVSWNHYRDFDNNASLPSTNNNMLNPYDTTVFFAREGVIYNITTSWEGYIITFANLETNLYIFNQSQFLDFENYIKPWLWVPNILGVDGFNSSHTSDDWIYEYSKEINNAGLPKIMNASTNFAITINKTGWYYLVMWGPENTENPKVATNGALLSEGLGTANVTVKDLMDMYRPALGKVNPTIDKPIKIYERILKGTDDIYGDSLALIFIYEYSSRKLKSGISFDVAYDWVPYIAFINPYNIGSFPDRIVCFYDDSWADNNDRYHQIFDPNFSLGEGIYNYSINTTAQLAPFLNETIKMSIAVNTTPISMENQIGSSVRLATTTNSHGFEIKPYNPQLATTFMWNEIPRYALNNTVLRDLYGNHFNEFIENNTWGNWTTKFCPLKTPFTLYFNSLFKAPYIASGLENILLIEPNIKDWIESIIQTDPYFKSNLEAQVNTTVDIPINFTLSYPENEPGIGETGNFTLTIGAMGNPNITIDYLIDYNVSFNQKLFTGDFNITKKGSIHFPIPLQEINLYLNYFGFKDGLSGIASDYIQKSINDYLNKSKATTYISIENFVLGNHVVGNIVTCDIRIHLWPIIKYLIKTFKPDLQSFCQLIDHLILDETTGLDLIFTPQLQGALNGTITGEGLEFENEGHFIFNETHKSIVFEANRTQDFSFTKIQLQSLLYYLNFHTNWTFEVNFNDIPHFFGQDDLSWFLGTYPNVDFAAQPMDNSDNLTLNWDEWAPQTPSPPTLSILTSSPTTSFVIALEWTTSLGADNYTLYRYTSPITSSNLHLATNVKTITDISTTDTVPGIGTWYYAVVATNETGNSDPSNSPYIDVQKEPESPNPPVLTITTTSPTTSFDISLEWTTSPGADNYTLYRYTSAITSSNLNLATEVKTTSETTTTDTVPGIGRWYYAVVASNESGSSDPSNFDFIDVQEESPGGGPGTISGYPLYFIGIACVIIILIVYKRVKQKS
ncbi:MAG: hypothetical protein ACFE9V_19935, partial [Candidatus Hodarchaeota archaeon]